MDDPNVANPADPIGQTPTQPAAQPGEGFTPPVAPAESATNDPVLQALKRIEEKLTAIAVKVGA